MKSGLQLFVEVIDCVSMGQGHDGWLINHIQSVFFHHDWLAHCTL